MPRDTQLAKHYFPTNFTLAKQLSENLFHFMVWCGMIWYGMVWYGMVWYGMALRRKQLRDRECESRDFPVKTSRIICGAFSGPRRAVCPHLHGKLWEVPGSSEKLACVSAMVDWMGR